MFALGTLLAISGTFLVYAGVKGVDPRESLLAVIRGEPMPGATLTGGGGASASPTAASTSPPVSTGPLAVAAEANTGLVAQAAQNPYGTGNPNFVGPPSARARRRPPLPGERWDGME